MMHRIGNCCGDARQPNLSNAARSELIHFLVGVVEEVHLAYRRIGVHCNEIVGQTAVDRRAVLRIVFRPLQQRAMPTPITTAPCI